MRIKRELKKHRFTIIGAIVGLIAGFIYWKFIGCNTGTCPITSRPINSSLYGALLGALIVNTFKK